MMQAGKYAVFVKDYDVPLNPWSTLFEVFTTRLKEASGGALPHLDSLFIYKGHEVLWGPDPEQWNAATKYFSQRLASDPLFLPGVAARLKKGFSKVEAYAARMLSTDFTALDNAALFALFEEGCGLYAELWSDGMIGQFLEMGDVKVSEVLKARISSFLSPYGDPETVFARLMTPRESSKIAEEHTAVLEAAVRLGEAPDESSLMREASALALWFGWLQYYYLGPAADARYYRSLLEKRIAKGDAAAELTSRAEEASELVAFQERIEAELPDADCREVRDLRLFAFLKEARKEYQYRVSYVQGGWYEEVARRFSITPLQAKYVLSREYREILSGTAPMLSSEALDGRYRSMAYALYDGEEHLAVGADVAAYEPLFKDAAAAPHADGYLKGSVAYPGRAKGNVKIVNAARDMEKFEDGDILVSFATNPVLVPAMNRAAAIVTNSGGITCHAAIVSRELKIPCIVGTKTATEVFKDGDLVEVDAEKGIVRKV